MTPIERLMEEHRTIERALDALDRFAGDVNRGALPDAREDLSKFVVFVREYADRTHHGKEEDILFAEMESAGFPRDVGPLAVMYAEHEEGRREVGILGKLSGQSSVWSEDDRRNLWLAAGGYTRLLRQHIQKEDQVLYPMARSRLSEDVWARIGSRFEEFESNRRARGEDERLRGLGEELFAKWGGG